MANQIITISREFGSGGRSIGKAAAEHLGIAYYDRELIEQVAVKSGYDPKIIENQGEYAPSNSLFAYAFVGRTVNGLSMSDYLWNAQREVILDIASKEKCVIVGRCADYILRDREDVLNVFIHADTAFKAKRIVDLYGKMSEQPEKRLMEKDKKRAINYQYYTDQIWGMAKNYHLSLNSGKLGIDECINIIVSHF